MSSRVELSIKVVNIVKYKSQLIRNEYYNNSKITQNGRLNKLVG